MMKRDILERENNTEKTETSITGVFNNSQAFQLFNDYLVNEWTISLAISITGLVLSIGSTFALLVGELFFSQNNIAALFTVGVFYILKGLFIGFSDQKAMNEIRKAVCDKGGQIETCIGKWFDKKLRKIKLGRKALSCIIAILFIFGRVKFKNGPDWYYIITGSILLSLLDTICLELICIRCRNMAVIK